MKAKSGHKSLVTVVITIILLSFAGFGLYFGRELIYSAFAHSTQNLPKIAQFSAVPAHSSANPTHDIINQFKKRRKVNFLRNFTRIKSSLPKNKFPLPPRNVSSITPEQVVTTPHTQVSHLHDTQEKPVDVLNVAISHATQPDTTIKAKLTTSITYPLTTIKQSNCLHSFPNLNITSDNILLYHSICRLKDENSIVAFRGTRVYTNMGLDFSPPHIVIHGKHNIRYWSDLATQINETHALRPENKAVHVHNELKIGDFLHFVLKEYLRKAPKVKGQPRPTLTGIVPTTATRMHEVMDLRQPPMVLSNAIDENWGFLSTCITNRSTCWINMTNHLLIHNANYDTVQQFLGSEKITLLLCNSHVDPRIGAHPKIIGLPLGLKARYFVFQKAMTMINTQYKKTKLLLINNSGWGPRSGINAMVSRAFGGSVTNSYSPNRSNRKEKLTTWAGQDVVIDADHYTDIAVSQFVLCPSGLGFDTYRLWEIIILGSIPIVESNAGFDRTYSHLPVLVVSDFKYVTPELLKRVYPCFVNNAHRFRYEHTTQKYWRDLVSQAVRTANIDHVMEAHPFRNAFCDFLDEMNGGE